jgi:hypothetical protein
VSAVIALIRSLPARKIASLVASRADRSSTDATMFGPALR